MISINRSNPNALLKITEEDLWAFVNLAIVAYLIHKWKRQYSFPRCYLFLVAWYKWDTIGITASSMFVVHYVLRRLQDRRAFESEGHIVGGSYPDGGNTRPDVHDPLVTRNVVVPTEEASKKNSSSPTTCNEKRSKEVNRNILEAATVRRNGNLNTNRNTTSSPQTARSQTISGSNNTQNDTSSPAQPPPLSSSSTHPGLDAFHLWMGAITDLYRSYSIAKTGEEGTIPNIILSHSERGRVSVEMRITNNLLNDDIDVYWIDYKGREQKRGYINHHQSNNRVIFQTWVGHPWCFRRHRDQQLLLHFVPFRPLPLTYTEINALKEEEEERGYDTISESSFKNVHEFTINEPTTVNDMCSIHDKNIPFPPTKIKSINEALEFSCQQMEREDVSPKILLKYLYNIALYPSESKYRQIRTSNKVFWSSVWCNGGRGILHALGFEEKGAYIEMGPDCGPLSGERLKHLADAIVMLEELTKDLEDYQKRARFGRFLDHAAQQELGRGGWGG